MEDGPGHRRDHLPAMVTRIRWTACDAVVLALLLACGTVGDATGTALFLQVFETGIIVWKLGVKINHGETQRLGYVLFDFHDAQSLPERLT